MSGDERDVVTLPTVTDTWNFRIGQPIECVMMPSGGVRLATRRERVWRRAIGAWLRWTRWWRPRVVTSAVDTQAGSITLSTERWSWRRWRWERT